MPFRLILALLVSTLLIGGASWSRLSQADRLEANLVTIEAKSAENSYYNDMVLATLEESTITPTASTEPLTGTDLVGRQLILDYLDLARSGQATEVNIAALANRYVESIPTLIASKRLNYFDLKVVPNDKAGFKNYSAAIEKIYSDYASSMVKAYSGEEEIMLGPESSALTLNMSSIYQETASSLQKLSVPAALAEAHLDLINIYLENATAMSSIAGADTDSASSFAGLITVKKNLEREEGVLSKIRETLAENGT